MNTKVLVAMSGGVDSSVAAALLLQQGFHVTGAYMKNWINEPGIAGDCPWQQDIADASAAAKTLGIPFRIVNLMHQYKHHVVNYLLDGYRSGLTPNPDALCNREIKFGAFLQWALDNGFDAIATGHYARIAHINDSLELLEAADKNKDQSYFLALLRQHQLQKALFPLANLTKPQVRQLALQLGLPNAQKKDSQGICFIGKVKIADFLRAYIPDNPGPVLEALTDKPLGTHRGLHLYTIGQARGVGIPSPYKGKNYVVVAKDFSRNALIMALESPDAPGLYHRTCFLTNVSSPGTPPSLPGRYSVRPRYRATPQPALVTQHNLGLRLEFDSPQRALTPGQIAVLYDGERVAAAGFISHVGDNP